MNAKSFPAIPELALGLTVICPLIAMAGPKTRERTVDPIVMECQNLAYLFGGHQEQLALMALGGWPSRILVNLTGWPQATG
jgi:hypothetical protein